MRKKAYYLNNYKKLLVFCLCIALLCTTCPAQATEAPVETTTTTVKEAETTETTTSEPSHPTEPDASSEDHSASDIPATEAPSPPSQSEESSSEDTRTSVDTEKTDPTTSSQEATGTVSSSESPEAGTTESTSDKTNKKKASSKKTVSETETKKLDDTIIDAEDSAEKEEDPETIDPRVYSNSQLITKENAEFIGNFIYFNQCDSVWNQNGYRIASAGCGPTSMAVVISSLTDQWVTPLDTAIWGYEHGYYSSAGSAHEMIPAMAEAFGLKCKGVGTDYEAIKKALKKGKPVIALMGPGYFTRKGHFMVLVGIDDNDNVIVADVASRERSSYNYALSDIIRQSKAASAGGPFWILSNPKDKKVEEPPKEPQPNPEYVLCPENLVTYHIRDKVSAMGQTGIIKKLTKKSAYILTDGGNYITTHRGSKQIPLSEIKLLKKSVIKPHRKI